MVDQRRAALRSVAPGALVLATVAAASLARGHRRAPLLLAAAAVLLVALAAARPGTALALRAAIGRVAAAIGAGLLHGALTVLAVLVVVPAWAVNQVVRSRALDDGWHRADSDWRTVQPARTTDGAIADVHRMGAREARRGPGVRGARWRRRGLAVVAIALVGGTIAVRDDGVGPIGRADPSSLAGYPVTGYAHEQEPWFPEVAAELQELSGRWDPFLGGRLEDQEGRHVNIVDGLRQTYQPDDPELTVWYFGGSTMFGFGQRDDHTIPSVIAQLAEDDGIRIRSLNFGVPGWVNWQETLQFAEELLVRDAPDLVVFYDGVNEVGAAYERVRQGDPDPDHASRQPANDPERELLDKSFPPREVDEAEAVDEQVALAAAQYGRGVELARTLADGHDVPVVHVWQPSLESKAFAPADQEAYDRTGLRRTDDAGTLPATTEVLRRSGADVVDLSAALDEVTVPVFFDGGHTNELGAATVAKALYAHLRPALEAARGAG